MLLRFPLFPLFPLGLLIESEPGQAARGYGAYSTQCTTHYQGPKASAWRPHAAEKKEFGLLGQKRSIAAFHSPAPSNAGADDKAAPGNAWVGPTKGSLPPENGEIRQSHLLHAVDGDPQARPLFYSTMA